MSTAKPAPIDVLRARIHGTACHFLLSPPGNWPETRQRWQALEDLTPNPIAAALAAIDTGAPVHADRRCAGVSCDQGDACTHLEHHCTLGAMHSTKCRNAGGEEFLSVVGMRGRPVESAR